MEVVSAILDNFVIQSSVYRTDGCRKMRSLWKVGHHSVTQDIRLLQELIVFGQKFFEILFKLTPRVCICNLKCAKSDRTKLMLLSTDSEGLFFFIITRYNVSFD